jgi:hypothetical protein
MAYGSVDPEEEQALYKLYARASNFLVASPFGFEPKVVNPF